MALLVIQPVSMTPALLQLFCFLSFFHFNSAFPSHLDPTQGGSFLKNILKTLKEYIEKYI